MKQQEKKPRISANKPTIDQRRSTASDANTKPGLVVEQIMNRRPDLTQKEIEDVGGGLI